MSIDHDDQPLDPRAMLDLAAETQAVAVERLNPDERVLYGTWAAAWTLAFLARWATAGDDPTIDAELGGAVVYGVALTAGLVVTIVHISSRVKGLGGAVMRAGRRWGASWFVAFAAYPFLLTGLDRAGATDELIELVAPLLATLIVGVLYMAGGALWDDAVGHVLGAWLLATAAAAAMVGVPEHYLVLGVGGGVGFLAAAVAGHRRRHEA